MNAVGWFDVGVRTRAALVGAMVALGTMTSLPASTAARTDFRSCSSVMLADGTRVGLFASNSPCDDASHAVELMLNRGAAARGWKCGNLGATRRPVLADCS